MQEYALTPQDIYRQTNGGLDVILRYYPQAQEYLDNRRKKFRIRDEKTPSCVLTEHDGEWYVKDFGSSERAMSAIDIVMLEDRVDFPRALQRIAEMMGIQKNDKTWKPASARYERRDATEDDTEGVCTWVKKDWETHEFKAIFAQNIWKYLSKKGLKKDEKPTDENGYKHAKLLCEKYNLGSLQSYSLVSKDKKQGDKLVVHTFFATEEYPILMYDEGDWQKFYKPKESQKEFRFFSTGRKPDDYMFGLYQLNKAQADLQGSDDHDDEGGSRKREKKVPEVIICTGGSDALNVAAMGYAVVWFNSETVNWRSEYMARLSGKADRVYNLPDIDATGLKVATQWALETLDLHTIYLPESLREKRDLRGNSCKDVRDYFRFYKEYDFKNLLTLAYPMKFWDEEVKRKDGEVVVKFGLPLMEYKPNNELIYNFLYRQGFGIMEMPTFKTGETLVNVSGHVVKKIEFSVINRYVKEFLRSRHQGVDLLNAFHRSPNFSQSSLQNLGYIQLPFEDTSRHDQYMFFQNVIWRITKNGIEESKPADCDRYVWAEEVIPHDVKRLDDSFRIFMNPATGKWDITIYNKDCLFLRFLINTSRIHWRKELEDELDKKPLEFRKEYLSQYQWAVDGPLLSDDEIQEQKQHLISKIISYGYYIHRYKDAASPLCVWALDYAVENTDDSNGGSGKSIYFKSLTALMKHHFLNGRDKNLTRNPHMMEGVDEHTDLVWMDDADKYLDLALFYPMITGPMTVNPKGTAGYTIDFEKSAKLGVTSNFPPSKNDKTTRRRLWYIAFSDYYHKNPNGEYRQERVPLGEFGKTLFTEFDEGEWNAFLNTAALACQNWMLHGQVEPPMEQVMANQYRSQMGETFHSWADLYFEEQSGRLDSMVPRYLAFETYKREGQGQISPQGFLGKLQAWCYYHGYVLNPPEAITNKDGRISKWMEKMIFQGGEWRDTGKKESVECMYIQTDPELPINAELPVARELPF